MTRSRYRLSVISPHAIVLAGLTTLLADHDDVEVVDPAPQDGHLAGLDVVIYDLGGLNDGRDELEHLVGQNAAVIGIELHPRSEVLADYLGLSAVLPLSISADNLVEHVRAAAAGVHLPHAAVDARSDRAGLSVREREVLDLIGRGLSNSDISDQLYITVNTVKTNIRGIYKKIGVQSRSQAVGWYLEHVPRTMRAASARRGDAQPIARERQAPRSA